MTKNAVSNANDQTELMRYLLVLELYRSGLSQNEIRTRLGISMNTVNAMLKRVSRTPEETGK